MPVYVRAGAILPRERLVQSTAQTPAGPLALEIYPGEYCHGTLYDDDGKTYAYEGGDRRITRLHWNNAAGRLTHEGAHAWTGSDAAIPEELVTVAAAVPTVCCDWNDCELGC